MINPPSIVPACLAALASTALSFAMGAEVDLPRYPSISPDGSQVVFSWRGDLWLVPTEGGEARRLTVHPGIDTRSAWSPDGSEIAFESDRDGYRNIWIMNADGSDLRQVVQTDRYAILADYGAGPDGPDAPTITFDSRIEGDFYRSSRPYEVPAEGGPFDRVHDAYGTSVSRSPSGDRALFERGGSSWTRRHYRGPDARDVWLMDSDGGFQRLTSWEGNDGVPRWLDDDTMVFMSDREHDTVNLYRQPVVAGVEAAEPLTAFEDRDVTAFDLSGDGRTAILQRWDTLYSLDLADPDAEPMPLAITANDDGMDRVVPTDVSRRVTEAALSPDGEVMAYVAYGDVWVRNVASSSPTRRVTTTLAHDQGIAWSPDGLKLYFVSDEDGTDTIRAATVRRTREEIRDAWKSAVEPEVPEVDAEADEESSEGSDEGAEGEGAGDAPGADRGLLGTWLVSAEMPGTGAFQLEMIVTAAEDGSLSVRLESPLYSGGGSATYDPETGATTLNIDIENGPAIVVEAVVDGDGMTGEALGPDGPIPVTATREAVVAAGPADGTDEEAAEETEGEEAEEEDDPMLDPDRWHDAIEFDIETVVESDANDGSPSPSPDGTKLAFTRSGGDVMLLDIVTGEVTTLHDGWDLWTSFVWAPDSRSIALTVDDRNFNSDIWLLPIEDPSAAVNISRHPDNDGSPSFSADGRILAFVSERSDEEFDVYRVYLDKSLEGLLEPELDDYYAEAAKAAKKRKPLAVRKPGDEIEDPEPADWTPSLDDAYLRLQRMSSLPGNERQVMITPAGDRMIYAHSGGAPGDSGLWSVKWNGSGASRIGSGSMQHLNLVGDKIVTVSGGASLLPVTGGSAKSLPIDADIDIDLEEQSSRKFREAARIFGEVFYHPDMKGYDWDGLAEDYHELAARAWTGDEFNWVAARLLGELNASHTGIRSPGYSSKLSRSQGRLGTIHRAHPEGGFEVLEIVEGSPAAEGPMPLAEGDVIHSINGEAIDRMHTLERALRGKVGEEVVLGIRRSLPGGEEGAEPRDVEVDALIKPITGPAFERLRRAQRERSAQALVDELSGGRVGYLHIESMNQASLDEFERDLYAVADGRDGLLIDVRNNGGGWTADRLLGSIDSRPHAYTVPRGADPGMRTGYPQDRLFIQRYILPINMLCNEKSFSNAEITSHAFKTLGRGTLVGQQTYGGVISTGGTSLVDGTSIRIPFRGWYLLDGTDMENNGAMPDIVVPQTPEDESNDHDAQLRTALEDLMKRLPERNDGE